MAKLSSKKSLVGSLLISIITPILVIAFSGSFPFLGVSFSLILLNLVVYLSKRETTKFDLVLLIINLILSSFVFVRSEPLLTFLNITAVIYLGSVMSLPEKSQKSLGFSHIPFLPLLVTVDAFANGRVEGKLFEKNSTKNSSEISLGIIASLLILVIIVPLLSSVNPIFENLVNTLLPNTDWLRHFRFDTWLFRLLVFAFLFLFVPRLVYRSNNTKSSKELNLNLKNISLNIPKLVTFTVLLIFLVTQLQFYISPDYTAVGYTHSEHAREVFAQLTVVAGVVLGLIYNDKAQNKHSRMLTILLLLEGVFMVFMGFKSVYEYSFSWGFTHKRLWGFTGVGFMLTAFVLYWINYSRGFDWRKYVGQVIVLSAITLVLVNLVNFDLLIFRFRKPSLGSGVDYVYLSRLSSDCMCYDKLYEVLSDPEMARKDLINVRALDRVKWSSKYLKTKYQNIDLRGFNINEYLQYRKIKDINL